MPTSETFGVCVYYHGDRQREAALRHLQRVDAARVHVYNGLIEGAADAEALDALHRDGLVVMDSGGGGALLAARPPQPQAAASDAPTAPSPSPTASAAASGAAVPGPQLLGAEPDEAPAAPAPEPEPVSAAAPAASGEDTATGETEAAARHEALLRAMRGARGTVDRHPALAALRSFVAGPTRSATAPAEASLLSDGPEPEPDLAADGDMYNVTVREPLQASDRSALEAIGSGVASVEPPNVFRMFLLPAELARVKALPFVNDATPYTLEETVTPDLMDLVPAGGARGSGKEETFDVLLHRGRDHDRVVAAVQAAGGRIVNADARHMIRISIPMDVAVLGALAQLPQVRKITPFQAPTLFSDHARALVGVDALNQAPAGQAAQQFTGAGETVAIFDSGVDAEHPDLKDRIKAAVPFQTAPVVDTVGHGTHVAGIIAGTGKASGGKIRGMAPGAELVVVGMVDASQRLLIPPDIRDLLKEAITDAHGAKIINLSWGNKFASEYEFGSLQLDWFVYEHEDVLVVVAAGNSGKLNGQGRYEFSSIGTPATAKNALTVGACGSDRADIALRWSDKPWSIQSPQGDYAMCSADSVAVLSSRGPTDYDSVKPDVCACGIYVASARASQATMTYWTPEPAQFADKYGYLGGTSMATPVVSGAAAVLREYLRVAQKRATPTAALLKAILIASARRLDSFKKEMGYPLEEGVGYPNFHQGFGRIDLSTVLPHAGAPKRKLACDDVRNGTDRALQAQAPVDSKNAAARTYTVKVAADAAEPLNVVLTWTDYPGKFLHDNLQLYVEGPGGVSVGNGELTFRRDAFAMDALSRGAAPDEVKFVQVPFDKYNNVEQVRIANPAAGEYRIVVLAQYTDPVVPAQGYALCVSGELESDQLSEG